MASITGWPFERIEGAFARGTEGSKALLAQRLEEAVRGNILAGRNTGSYSTRSGWFSLSPLGHSIDGNLYEWARTHRQPKGMGYVRGAAFFPQGYAQYRAIFRGEGGWKKRPVTFEFTGEMMEALIAKGRPSPRRGVAVASLGFVTNERSYGRLTNMELAKILVQIKGGGHNPFAPMYKQRRAFFGEAFRQVVTAVRNLPPRDAKGRFTSR